MSAFLLPSSCSCGIFVFFFSLFVAPTASRLAPLFLPTHYLRTRSYHNVSEVRSTMPRCKQVGSALYILSIAFLDSAHFWQGGRWAGRPARPGQATSLTWERPQPPAAQQSLYLGSTSSTSGPKATCLEACLCLARAPVLGKCNKIFKAQLFLQSDNSA